MKTVINTQEFGKALNGLGYQLFSGVPCSYLESLINYCVNRGQYISAVNEGDAVAIASGAWVGGQKAGVLMQNSGLTNAISPLTSLNYPFRIPILGFVSLRGEPGTSDEPQHELMGKITMNLLQDMGIRYEVLLDETDSAIKQLKQAEEWLAQGESFIFIVKKNTFSKITLAQESVKQTKNVNCQRIQQAREDALPSRYEALRVINRAKTSNTIQLVTTGKAGRELYDLEDAPNNLYLVGSMGCVSSFGLGLAWTRLDREVTVIDGDGSLLMRMGCLATIGSYNPANLLHILLDNHAYESTGGQPSVAENVNFVEVAAACGYARSIYIHDLVELEACIQSWQQNKMLTFCYLKVAKGSKKDLGRPQLKPYEVTNRLRGFLNG